MGEQVVFKTVTERPDTVAAVRRAELSALAWWNDLSETERASYLHVYSDSIFNKITVEKAHGTKHRK